MEWEVHRDVFYEKESEIEQGKPIETYVFDAQTYERRYVRAIISKPPKKLEDGENLWVRDFQGRLEPEPWAIRIIEELPSPWEAPPRDFLEGPSKPLI